VEAARQHLETVDLPLKRIARLTGFRDEQALRRAFIQELSVTPWAGGERNLWLRLRPSFITGRIVRGSAPTEDVVVPETS